MKDVDMARSSAGRVAASSLRGFADAAKSCGTKKTVRTTSAILRGTLFMQANVKLTDAGPASALDAGLDLLLPAGDCTV